MSPNHIVKISTIFTAIDFSGNKFQGEIPKSIGNLNSLREFNLSHEVLNLFNNRLTRFVPQGNQVETFGNDSCGWNSRLCGFPLSKKCSIEETLVPIKEVDAKFESGFD